MYAGEVLPYVQAKTNKDANITIKSLRRSAQCLAQIPYAIKEIFLETAGAIQVQSWEQAFFEVWRYACATHLKRLNKYEAGGFTRWIKKKYPRLSLLANLDGDNVSFRFASKQDLCAWMQWLLLVSGHELNKSAICFDKTQAPLPAQPLPKTDNAAPKKQPVFVPAWPKDGSTAIDAKGKYIVENGVVVFLSGRGQDTADNADTKIVRSESDSEDTWKGFGVGHPDTDGKFGGLIGEDWAD